jgi:hypothetical protein
MVLQQVQTTQTSCQENLSFQGSPLSCGKSQTIQRNLKQAEHSSQVSFEDFRHGLICDLSKVEADY